VVTDNTSPNTYCKLLLVTFEKGGMGIVFIKYVVVSSVKYCCMHEAQVMCEQNKMWQDCILD
jgi:hypothetical protein